MKVSVRLKDGRQFDFERNDHAVAPELESFTEEIFKALDAAGVTPEQVDVTIHYIAAGKIPARQQV
jgi:hypothetical protein